MLDDVVIKEHLRLAMFSEIRSTVGFQLKELSTSTETLKYWLKPLKVLKSINVMQPTKNYINICSGLKYVHASFTPMNFRSKCSTLLK